MVRGQSGKMGWVEMRCSGSMVVVAIAVPNGKGPEWENGMGGDEM